MTAYEMRISDWSSYVCSSDLDLAVGIRLQGQVLLLGTQLTIKRADCHIVCEPCGEMIVRGTNFARARQKAEDVAGGFRQCAQRACCKIIAIRTAAGRRGAVDRKSTRLHSSH